MTNPQITRENPLGTRPDQGWTCVLFDLDGTLIDSAPGIIDSLKRVLTAAGIPVPPEAILTTYVGPPLLRALADDFGLDHERAHELLTVYRRDYAEHGALDTAVFPGLRGILERLTAAGVPLAVATSKPETQAVRILEHLNVAAFFEVIAGAHDDESHSGKAEIVANALERLRARGVNTDNPVMIGDRIYDVDGAAAHDIPTVLVEWGYGSPSEAHDALAVVHSTEQLQKILE